jgi:hypothetical protein
LKFVEAIQSDLGCQFFTHKNAITAFAEGLDSKPGEAFGVDGFADGEVVWAWRPDAGAEVAESSANDGGKRARSQKHEVSC